MAWQAALSIGSIDRTRWAFALRIWGAIMLALGVAFLLELDGASSAGICVAILALQTRGQVVEKAIYRMLGTIVGGIAAIILANVFGQVGDLYVIACSAWLGICVFAAGFLDGNRAYGAVLCGYTVSIVAIQRTDMPDQVSSAAVDRVAAIAVGIAAISLVNSVLSAPEITPLLVQRLYATRASVRALEAKLRQLGRTNATDGEAARILRALADRHPELGALSAESLVGRSRAAAARAVAAALAGEVVTTSRLATLQGQDDVLESTQRCRLLNDLDTYRMAEQHAERSLQTGRSLPNAPAMPTYRSWESAMRNASRAFITSTMTGFGFVLTGWPEADWAWSFVGIVICLSANAPDPRVLGRAALIAMPASVALAGVTLFIILDGSDAFPLLCAGLSPAIVGGAVLITSPILKYSAIGSLMTVFTLVLIGVSNPQSYDPSTYLIRGFLMILATLIVYVAVCTLFPVEDIERRAWVLRSAKNALRGAINGKTRFSEAEALLLDASRIAALAALQDVPEERQSTALSTMFRLADLRSAVQRVRSGLDRLDASRGQPLASLRNAIKGAFAQNNVDALGGVASVLIASRNPLERDIGGDIALTAVLMKRAQECVPSTVEER